MQNLMNDLTKLFQKDERIFADGKLLKNKLTELALKLDQPLLDLLLSDNKAKEHFFIEKTAKKEKVLVFDKDKFIAFVNNKEFLPDSFTSFKNKIGLMTNGDYLKEKDDVVLAWAYKDCVLEGGQDKEDQKRDEIFYNETLSPDEIDRLFEPKVLANFKKYDSKGEHKVVEFNADDNLIIKGNNLLALHCLEKKFRGKVKLIYIDPPYNMGGDGFGYNDKFNHSTWLTFMKNRLEIAHELLSNDGAIFVQIDYHEIAYLKVLMDEIFCKNDNNFIQLISVKTSSPAGFKTVNPGPIDVTEYILFYTKARSSFNFRKCYVPVDYDENYDLVITNKEERPEKWKLRSLRDVIYEQNGIAIGETPQQSAKNAKNKWGDHWEIIRRQLMAKYALENADKVVSIRDPHKPTAKLRELLEESKKHKNKIFVHSKESNSSSNRTESGYVLNGGALAFYSNKVKMIDGRYTATELLTDCWLDISWDGIAKEGGVKLKNGKKPERLIRRIIEIVLEEKQKGIVMDFFCGSGTTCAVAHKLGKQYIGIEQLDYSDNDSRNRLINVINKDSSGISKIVNWNGGGSFVYAELMEWNERYMTEIKDADSSRKLLSIYEKMKKEAFFRYDIDLSKFEEKEFEKLPIKEQKQILCACLDKNHLYVNLSEIDDATYKVSTDDKKLNAEFYKTVV